MLRGITRYVRPHHIVLLGLFLAFGGTSVAAANALLPKNSVGTAQLKNGAVTNTKIARKTLRQLKGNKGGPGPRGPAGPTGPPGASGVDKVVNIADPTTPSNVAKVDADGALKTAGTATVSGFVGETAPNTPIFGHAFVLTSSPATLIAANTATVALTRLSFENHYGQTGSATANLVLFLQGGNPTTCDGSSGTKEIGSYDVPAGQTLADVIGSPIVLKPLLAGDVWCLTAQATLQGNPGSYFIPSVAWSGYVAAGTLPAGAMATSSAKPGEAPRATP